jgi:hypothetical protein
MSLSLIAALVLGIGPAFGGDVGPLVRALWLVQRFGTDAAVDPSNDQRVKGTLYKALGMVCGEADAACPFVKGAALRVSMPYLDPKIYDGGAYDAAKYAERRDDMGRLMLAVMMQARQRIASLGTPAEGTR